MRYAKAKTMPEKLEQLHELLRSTVVERSVSYSPEIVSVVLDNVLESYVETAEICIGATFGNTNLDGLLKSAEAFAAREDKLGLAAYGYHSAGITALGQRNPAAAEYFRKAGEVRLKQLHLECIMLGIPYDEIIAIEAKTAHPISTPRDMAYHLLDLAKNSFRIASNAETAFKLLYESVDAIKQSPDNAALILEARAEIIEIRRNNTEKLRQAGLSDDESINFIATVGSEDTDSTRGIDK